MTTSGTTTFNPDVSVFLEEAFDRAGYEGRSGYEYRTAIRSLNFLLAEWANEGLNLWAVDSGTIPLVAADGQYSLPTDTVDIIDAKIRVGDRDFGLERAGVGTFASINDKTQEGPRPTLMWVERLIEPRVNLWPVPQDASCTLVYWRLRRLQDAGSPDKTIDVPYRFLSALAAGLAVHLYRKRPDCNLDKLAVLEAHYMRQLDLAKAEDRGRESFFIRPQVRR